METKFTTDTLKVYYPSVKNPDDFRIGDIDGIIYASVHGANGTEKEMVESEANAKLFAAAPDLFHALSKLIQNTKEETNGDDFEWIMNYTGAIKAIKKATE